MNDGMTLDDGLTIGRVAKAAGVNVETIRYYQRRGLLAKPQRRYGTHTRYSRSAVSRVLFIKCAQHLDFTLDDIAALLTMNGTQRCQDARSLGEQKLATIEARIAELCDVRSHLRGLLAECARNEQSNCCPMIDSLTECSSVPPCGVADPQIAPFKTGAAAKGKDGAAVPCCQD